LYFTFGGYPQGLGLGDYSKRVGLVQKLETKRMKEDANTALIGGTYVDIERSLALWRSYAGAKQLLREGRWVDQSSASVPVYYAAIGQDLAQALAARGRTAEAEDVIAVVRQLVVALELQ